MHKGLKIRTKAKTGPSPQIALNSQSSYTESQENGLTKRILLLVNNQVLEQIFSHHCQAGGEIGRRGVAEAGGVPIRNT